MFVAAAMMSAGALATKHAVARSRDLLGEHPRAVAVKNLVEDPDNWAQMWALVQRLAEEQLVELGQSDGDDRSNVPITLTPEGETIAHTL
jgi:hypothetical protein